MVQPLAGTSCRFRGKVHFDVEQGHRESGKRIPSQQSSPPLAVELALGIPPQHRLGHRHRVGHGHNQSARPNPIRLAIAIAKDGQPTFAQDSLTEPLLNRDCSWSPRKHDCSHFRERDQDTSALHAPRKTTAQHEHLTKKRRTPGIPSFPEVTHPPGTRRNALAERNAAGTLAPVGKIGTHPFKNCMPDRACTSQRRALTHTAGSRILTLAQCPQPDSSRFTRVMRNDACISHCGETHRRHLPKHRPQRSVLQNHRALKGTRTDRRAVSAVGRHPRGTRESRISTRLLAAKQNNVPLSVKEVTQPCFAATLRRSEQSAALGLPTTRLHVRHV